MIYDFIIAGGGLAGSLFLKGLRHTHPECKALLLEQADQIGGNHTWCFHQHDLPRKCQSWVAPLVSHSWQAYEVHFPKYSRKLPSAYNCIKSDDLHQKLSREFPNEIRLSTQVLTWEKKDNLYQIEVQSAGQKSQIKGKILIDARGWVQNISSEDSGWQKFVGLEVELESPHALDHVILKDVQVAQIDGYRFFYMLPFSPTQILVEDTYFSNSSDLDVDHVENEIKTYIQKRGWKIKTILRKEVGCLPLNFNKLDRLIPKHIALGASSLLFHPVTGYTFPMTIRVIDQILALSKLTEENIKKTIDEFRDSFSGKEKYMRFLNRMMYLVAEPQDRYKILERFYKLDIDLIHRFYSGQMTAFDQVRILAGKPPVPVGKAIRVLADS